MPTHDEDAQFWRDLALLSADQQTLFATAVRNMVEDLRAKKPFRASRASMRVRGVQGHPGTFEMTRDMPNGRATFTYGAERTPGDPHIHWRRIGGHDIFGNP